MARLRRLPKLEGFPVDAVPVSPRPSDSELYVTIRERVRKEVFKGSGAAQPAASLVTQCIFKATRADVP